MHNRVSVLVFSFLLFIGIGTVQAQDIAIEGYTYESGNRGYVAAASVMVYDGDDLIKTSLSNADGLFVINVPKKDSYRLEIAHDLYQPYSQTVDCSDTPAGEKVFVKAEMRRAPGYLFEVTMAEEKLPDMEMVDAISGARIDVYNNTKEKEVFVLDGHVDPHFSVPLVKGNHYTVLIRKEGFIAKRIEAFVDVEGCILCFEGLGTITPGVTDNLSERNTIGVLLANVTLERVFSGKMIELRDLYYDLGSARLKSGAKKELRKLVRLMNDNPEIKVELGSHTDSRGGDDLNMDLSQRRAQSAVDYLISKGIDNERIISQGYGETQLRNECANGVNCSEIEHGYNRRTELRILEVAKSNERIKSLAELIMMEKGEKELEEFAFQGQVKNDGPTEDSLSTEDMVTDSLAMETEAEPIISYSVIIHETAEALPSDHPLFTTHSDLKEVNVKGAQYYYATGNYSELSKAETFLKTSIQAVYPDARIMKFVDGVMVEE